ncbi:hypothetical protein PHAVU_008G195328 [Phaseolus vulgaris]
MQVIKESFVLGGFSLVKVRYLGGRFVLLSCDDGGSLKKIIADNRSWFDEAFSAVTPWDGSFELKERFAWIRCSGIPLQFWCKHSFSKIGVVVGEVMEVDEVTERRETVEFARFRVKTSVRSTVNMEKELCINGRSCKVAFVEEMSVPEQSLGKWNGGALEVDTEANSDDGSVGASLCDSVGSELGLAGDGGVGAVGEGGLELEETVQGMVDPVCLGKGREGWFQDNLRGPMNVHGISLRKRVELVGGHGSLSCSKIEIVDSYVEVASSKESKSANDKARSNGGVSESRCMLRGNVRAGASFQAPPQEPFQEVGMQEINDGGLASLKVCPPMIKCVENGVLSVKGVVGDLKCQSAFMKPCKENLSVQDGCHEEEEGEVGSVSRQTSSVSRVANSVGICPSLNDLEQSGTSVIRDGVDGSSVATVKDIPKSPVVQGLNDSELVDPEKLVDAEGARRSEMSKSRDGGCALPPGGLLEDLGAGMEDEVEGGGNNGDTEGRVTGLDGEVVGRQSSVEQVFLVHQTGSSSNSLFTSDSAIENCNMIFWVKTDKNLAASVWGVGKEAGFSLADREEVVLDGIYSLSNQGGVTTRRMWKERSKVVNEDS